ncbi:MAG: tRNA (adenosine(37)-N6)-threonylcarbamoyltransferase complex transferase subunit TsaD [Acidimicrobiales bacterium]
MTKVLLAIETSCDETAAAVVTEDLQVLSSIVSSQVDLHARFGGVVPEIASRAHVQLLGPIISGALDDARTGRRQLSAVAVTRGPGLVGALLVGISTAKALAAGLGVPVVAVNHLEGHLASVQLGEAEVAYPQLALLVSGGHCVLARTKAPGHCEVLGQTKDDSVGEAYDKVARLLGLGYPGGPVIDRLAAKGTDTLAFPRPMLNDGYDFSFSGLKTAVANYVRANPQLVVEDVAASFAAACMDVLCTKLRRALSQFGDPVVSVVGGVAASPILRARAAELADDAGSQLLLPPQRLATDNAAMIGVAAWQRLTAVGTGDRLDFGPLPSWPLSDKLSALAPGHRVNEAAAGGER